MAAEGRFARFGLGSRRVAVASLCAATLWLITSLFQIFDGNGPVKALLLLTLGVAAIVLTLGIERRSPESQVATPAARLVLAVFCAALAANRVRIVYDYLATPDLADIGTTTLAAIKTVLAGHNPYATPLDLHPDEPQFAGYKYLPVMMAIYAPLSFLPQALSLPLTNLFLDALAAALIGLAARRMTGDVAGLLGACLYLALPVLPLDLYSHGVTDLAAVVPLLAALTMFRTRPGVAGWLIGLSIAAKLFPGLLVALCCAPGRMGWARYAIAGLLGFVVPVVGFLFWDPDALITNTVRFVATRRADHTSWMYGLPPIAPMIARIGYAALLGCLMTAVLTTAPGLVRRIAMIVVAILASFLSGPGTHNNYLLWLMPFVCILLGCRLALLLDGARVTARPARAAAGPATAP